MRSYVIERFALQDRVQLGANVQQVWSSARP